MKKYIFSALILCAAGAFSPQVDLVISPAYAAVDPVPGIDIIVDRDPEGEPISVGACLRNRLVIVKNNKGQWKCVTKARASQKYPSKKTYSIRNLK